MVSRGKLKRPTSRTSCIHEDKILLSFFFFFSFSNYFCWRLLILLINLCLVARPRAVHHFDWLRGGPVFEI